MKKEHTERFEDHERYDVIACNVQNNSDKSLTAMQNGLYDTAGPEHDGKPKLPVDWSCIRIVMPRTKTILHMRIDTDIMEFFKNQGKGYQSKINAVLRSYVEQYKD